MTLNTVSVKQIIVFLYIVKNNTAINHGDSEVYADLERCPLQIDKFKTRYDPIFKHKSNLNITCFNLQWLQSSSSLLHLLKQDPMP